jgi:hypothetical protein
MWKLLFFGEHFPKEIALPPGSAHGDRMQDMQLFRGALPR